MNLVMIMIIQILALLVNVDLSIEQDPVPVLHLK